MCSHPNSLHFTCICGPSISYRRSDPEKRKLSSMAIRWSCKRAICKRAIQPQARTVTEKHIENLHWKMWNFIGKYPTTQNGRWTWQHWLCWGLGFTSRYFLYIYCILYIYKLLMLCTALSEEISMPSDSFDCSSIKYNVPGSRSAA